MDLNQTILKLSETIRNWTNTQIVESSANSLELKPLLVTNLNDATEPGFYFFGSAHPIENAPINAGLLLVFNDRTQSGFERHYQMLFAYETNKIFFRTVKVKGVYQEWETIHDNKPVWEPLISSTLTEPNLDYVTIPGSYNLSSDYQYENVPDREIAGLLIVYNDTNSSGVPTRLYQMFIGYRRGNMFIRHRVADGTFTEWQNLITDPALIDIKADKDTVMLKDDYLEYAQGNLFDGNFIEGYQVCNPNQGAPFFNYNPDFKYLAIFNVKPNTPYTIEIDNPVLEPLNEFDGETSPQFYYFKAYSATRKLEAGEPFDGEIKCVKTRTPTYRYTVTTGPNDAVIYIQAAKNTDQVPYLQFTEGHYGNYINLGYGSDTYIFTDKVSLSPKQIQQAVDAVDDGISEKVIEDVTAKLDREVIPGIADDIKANLITGAQLFDGSTYLDQMTITGNKGSYKLAKNAQFSSTYVVPVKPNTTYTLFRESAEKEYSSSASTGSQYHYGKVATSTTLINVDAITTSSSTFVTFDGSVQLQLNADLRTTFTTGEQDKYLYVQVARSNKPQSQVVEGNVQELPYGTYYGSVYKIQAKPTSDSSSTEDIIVYTEDAFNQYLDAKTSNISDNVLDRVKSGEFLTNAQLFDGVSYITGFYLTGNTPYKLQRGSAYTSTFVVPVEPNTEYTIFRERVQKEDDGNGNYYYYGKCATSSTPIDTTKAPYQLDGSLSKQLNDSLRTVITTGANDYYLVVQSAKALKPGVQVVKGDVQELPYGTYYGGAYTLEVKPHESAETEKVTVYTQDALDSYISRKFSSGLDESALVKYNNLVISKTDNKIVIKKGRTTYELQKITDSSINLSTWRWLGMSVDEQTLFHGADCEGVVLEQGASDHIGGFHGDETYTDIQIFVDGELIDETAVITERICQQIVLLVTSDVYSCINPTTKLFRRIKKLDWKDNTLNVYNTWEHIGSTPVSLNSVKLSGMFSADCSCLRGYACNVVTPVESYDAYTMPFENYKTLADFKSIGFNKDLDEVTLYGRTGYSITIKSFDKDQGNYGGRILAYDFDPSVSLDEGRLKIYLESYQAVSSTAAGYQILPGEVLRGHFEITVDENSEIGNIAYALKTIKDLQQSYIGGNQ